jgi:hypothetical protein
MLNRYYSVHLRRKYLYYAVPLDNSTAQNIFFAMTFSILVQLQLQFQKLHS